MRHARTRRDHGPQGSHRGIAAIAIAVLVAGLGMTASAAQPGAVEPGTYSEADVLALGEEMAAASPAEVAPTAPEAPAPVEEPAAVVEEPSSTEEPSTTEDPVAAVEPAPPAEADALEADAREPDGVAVAPLAVGVADGAPAPYVHWDVVDSDGNPVAGATFDFARRGNWNSWTGQRSVADCVAGTCTGVDRDVDPAELLVKWIGSDNPGATPSGSGPADVVQADSRYRIRPAAAPAGYEWVGSTGWVDSNDRTWTGPTGNRTLDLGTFQLRRIQTLPVCEAGYVYSITGNGQLQQVAPGGVVTALGSAAGGSTFFNGLGIGASGEPVFSIARTTNLGTNIGGTIHRYDTVTGQWSSTGASIGDTGTNLVGGAIDLSSGLYHLGGFTSNGNFRLYRYNPAAGTPITFLGTVATGAGSSANGDIAFDASGNLFIVRGSGTSTTVYSVTAANLAAADGGTITSAVSSSFTTMENVNGIAFDASGQGFLGSATTMRSYDMPNWVQNPAGNVTTSLGDSTDLATCSSPPTITIEKYVEGGRVNAGDQFQLTLNQGSTLIGTTTTTGSANGLQNQRIGPLPTVRNVALTFAETAAGTTNLNQYVSSYRCLVDGVQTTQGPGRSGSITIPSGGQSVECRIYNSPVAAQVTITKLVTDSTGQNPQPRADWTVSATATATTGSITSGSQPASQQTAASGTAAWDYTFGSTASRATVTVAETMQPGYAFSSGECVLTHLDGTTVTVALTGPGSQALAGVAPGDRVDCTYVNTPTPGGLAVVKILDSTLPDGSGAIEFTGTYTCVLGGTTVASGSWSVTGAGGAVLTPAGAGIPAGAACTVQETPPVGSDGLPNDSFVWGDPMVGPGVTIASGTTSTIAVTNTVTRVHGAFQVTKVVPEGSTVDADATFTGDWSCTLDGETVSGTWGPIGAGATWTSPESAQIPTGAECTVTSEIRAEQPVAADPSHRWDGEPDLGDPVVAVTDGPLGTVTVTNTTARELGSVVWTKVDGAGQQLASSEWLLTGPGLPAEGATVLDCIADTPQECAGPDVDPTPGGFEILDLAWGDYTLVETRAPAGYELSPTVHEFTIGTVAGSTAVVLDVDLGALVNEQRDQPTLPLTGGLGADGFAIVGTGVLAGAALVLLVLRKRRLQS